MGDGDWEEIQSRISLPKYHHCEQRYARDAWSWCWRQVKFNEQVANITAGLDSRFEEKVIYIL